VGSRELRLVAGALLLALPVAAPAASRPPGAGVPAAPALAPLHSAAAAVERCERTLAESHDSVAAVRCLVLAGSTGLIAPEALAGAIDERLARDPSNPVLRLARAVLADEGGHPDAESDYAGAAAAFAASGDRPGQVLALVSLSSFHSRRRSLEAAIAALDDARRAAEAAGSEALAARVEIQAAWVAYARSDYGEAGRTLDAVTAAARRAGSDLLPRWLGARAATFWAVGDHRAAAAAYQEQLRLLHEAGDVRSQAATLNNLALLSRGEAKRAYAWRSLEIARRTGDRSSEAYALFYLSEASSGAESIQFARRALAAARAARNPAVEAMMARRLAVALVATNPAEAYRLIEDSIATARGLADADETVRQLIIRSIMRWQTGPRERAVADSLEAIDAIERIRNLQPEDGVRARRFAQWRYAYYRLAWHLLQGTQAPDGRVTPEERELAFATLERVRARLLLERLDSAQAPAASRLPADHPLRQARRRLLQEIAAINRRLAARDLASADRSEALAELARLEREEEAVSARLALEDPSFAAVRLPPQVRTADLRAALSPDEALVVLQVIDLPLDSGGSYGGWVWVLTRDALDLVRIADSSGLRARIDALVGLIARRDSGEALAAARLWRDVFSTALDDLPARITRLVLVADEALPALPFAALRGAPDAPPLGDRYELTLAPSVSMWLAWRRRPPAIAPYPALVLASPARAGAPAADSSRRSEAPWLPASSLPFGRQEGRWLLRELGPGTRVLAGPDASEARLKAEPLSNYRLLHFAAHASVDTQHPERTAVLLADGGPHDDGLLQAREIVELPLDDRVVVLSACESAGGKLVPGEGFMGLAHAFFRAGARTVVANLWPVRDRDAARMFELVARHLGAGRSVSESVALARRELIAAGAPTDAWAGLVVLGDGRITLTPAPAVASGWPALATEPALAGVATAGAVLGMLLLPGLVRRR
jgi:hypothetical protein